MFRDAAFRKLNPMASVIHPRSRHTRTLPRHSGCVFFNQTSLECEVCTRSLCPVSRPMSQTVGVQNPRCNFLLGLGPENTPHWKAFHTSSGHRSDAFQPSFFSSPASGFWTKALAFGRRGSPTTAGLVPRLLVKPLTAAGKYRPKASRGI